MTIKEAQEAVDKWIKEYGVRDFSELTNMACLTEEVGELARVIARTYGDQSFKKGEKPNLGEEMADVLWVLICLANQTGPSLAINKAFWDMRVFTIKGCTSSKTRMRFVSQYKSASLTNIKAHC